LSWLSPVQGVAADRGGHGIRAEVVIAELTAAGFVLEEQIADWGAGSYCLVFARAPLIR